MQWPMRSTMVCALGCLTLAAAPAWLHAQAPGGRRCEPDAIDSAIVKAPGVYGNCEVDQPAKLKRKPEPHFDFTYAPRCSHVNVAFVVDSTGEFVPGTQSLILTDSKEYAELVIKNLKLWRYEPAKLNGRPVSQRVLLRHVRQDDKLLLVGPGKAKPQPFEKCVEIR